MLHQQYRAVRCRRIGGPTMTSVGADGLGDMDARLEGKDAVVYGGGGSIGGAVARAFAREGARVHLAGRTSSSPESVAGGSRAAGGVAEIAVVDALDERAVDEHALLGRVASLADVGNAAVWAASDLARASTAATINISAGAPIDQEVEQVERGEAGPRRWGRLSG